MAFLKKVKIKGEEVDVSDDAYALYDVLERLLRTMRRTEW